MDASADFQRSISIIYSEIEEQPGGKGLGSIVRRTVTKVGQVDPEELARNLRAFCTTVGTIISGLSSSVREYELERVEIRLEITGKGEVRFIGSAGTEIQGGIALVFTKSTIDLKS